MDKKIRIINEAEGIFLPCFDMTINKTEEFSGSGCQIIQSWDSLRFESASRKFSVCWNGCVKTGKYNELLFFITLPEYMLMSASANINGEEIKLFENCRGNGDGPGEPCGKIPKDAKVSGITMQFETDGADLLKYEVNLSWIGLRCAEKVAEITFPKYDINSWEGSVNFNTKPFFEKNVYFSGETMAGIKEKLKKPEYAALAEAIRRDAAALENFEPETQIGRYMPVVKHVYRYVRIRDRGREVFFGKVFPLAAAGYLFDNPKWSALAARIIMSMVKCPCWFEGPQCRLEGSTWHHVCFTEFSAVTEILTSISFLGGMFTEKAKKEIIDAVQNGYKTVVKCCRENGYRKFSNQGIVESGGRMVGACGLYYLGVKDYISEAEECYEEHKKMLENYIGNDGYCYEGPGYFQYSMENSINLWRAYALLKNVPVASIIPERIRKSVNYINAFLSTTDLCGSAMPFNNSHAERISDQILNFFANQFGWEKGKALIKNRSAEKDPNELIDVAGLLFAAADENKALECKDAENEAKENKYYVFEKSGLGVFESEKTKFWFLCEGNPRTGHYHFDRGSVVLEYNNAKILADLGVTDYSNWISRYMNKEQYHNLAHPEGISMKLQSDIATISANEAGIGCRTVVSMKDFERPSARIKYIRKTENGISFSGDLTEIYPGVLSAVREGYYKTQKGIAELFICDEWLFDADMPLWVNFAAYAPWKIKEKSASVCIGGVQLKLEFNSEEKFGLEEDKSMRDSLLKQIYILRLKTEGRKVHKVITKGVVEEL